VTDHQGQAQRRGQLDEFIALGGGSGHGLLDEDVLAGEKTFLRHGIMRMGRGGDDHGVQIGTGEESLKIRVELDLRVERLEMIQPLDIEIANGEQTTVREVVKIPDQVRTPIPATDNADVKTRFHGSIRQRWRADWPVDARPAGGRQADLI
jgi:hypothetical protein